MLRVLVDSSIRLFWCTSSLEYRSNLHLAAVSALLNQNIRTLKNLSVYRTRHGWHPVENTSVEGTVARYAIVNRHVARCTVAPRNRYEPQCSARQLPVGDHSKAGMNP